LLTLEAGSGYESVRRAVQIGVELDLRGHVAAIVHLGGSTAYLECNLHDGMINHPPSPRTPTYRVVDNVADVVVVVRAKSADGRRRRVEHHGSTKSRAQMALIHDGLDTERLPSTRDVEAIAYVARHDRDFVQVGHRLWEDKVLLPRGRLDLTCAP